MSLKKLHQLSYQYQTLVWKSKTFFPQFNRVYTGNLFRLNDARWNIAKQNNRIDKSVPRNIILSIFIFIQDKMSIINLSEAILIIVFKSKCVTYHFVYFLQ